jgi:hypothetical protein
MPGQQGTGRSSYGPERAAPLQALASELHARTHPRSLQKDPFRWVGASLPPVRSKD